MNNDLRKKTKSRPEIYSIGYYGVPELDIGIDIQPHIIVETSCGELCYYIAEDRWTGEKRNLDRIDMDYLEPEIWRAAGCAAKEAFAAFRGKRFFARTITYMIFKAMGLCDELDDPYEQDPVPIRQETSRPTRSQKPAHIQIVK